MNRLFHDALVVCLATVGLALNVGSASAQMLDSLKVKLPQAVSVAGASLPAGEYTIQDISSSGTAPVFVIQSTTGTTATVIGEPILDAHRRTPAQTEVVLRPSASGLQLDKIFFAGQDTGYQIVSVAGHE